MMDCRGEPACTNSRVLNPSVNREATIIGVLRVVSFDYCHDGYICIKNRVNFRGKPWELMDMKSTLGT